MAIIAHINGCLFKKYCFAAKKLFFVKQNAIFAALLAIKQTLASLPCSIKNNQNKTMYQTILFEQFDGVATITLNRPDRYNAFTPEMLAEIHDALKKCAKDNAVRVIVITGAGKAFNSGQDLKNTQASIGTRNLGEAVEQHFNPLIKFMYNLPKPIICRLNGVAAGAGCSLALACDMVIASENASLIEVFVNIGLVPDSGSSYFLPRVVGSKKAFELCTMGNKVSAQEALTLGMVNKVVPHNDLDAEVKRVADYFATAPTKAIGYIKKMLNKSMQADLATMLQEEAYYQELAGYSHDYKEGVAAFIEKRPAQFKGE